MDNKYRGKVCPYCKTEIKNGDEIIVCSTCEIPHHAECWRENGGCTTFGCSGQAIVVNPVQPIPAGGRTCPHCGSVVEEGYGFCSACGQRLVTTTAFSQTPVAPQAETVPASIVSRETVPPTQQTPMPVVPMQSSVAEPVFATPARKKKKVPWPVIILSVLLVAATAAFLSILNANQLYEEYTVSLEAEIEELNDTVEKKDKEISRQKKENQRLDGLVDKYEDSYYFYDAHAACVADDGTRIYHKFDCYKFNGSFWIYNTEAAIGKGYRACTYCF